MDDKVFTELRAEYQGEPLREDAAPRDPFAFFQAWFEHASALPMANAMTLATVDQSGMPTARIVLLKSFDTDGFVFFTNYESRKARALEANPLASLLFYWEPAHRQIRIEGTVERVAPEESDAYFASRPRESNLSAMTSPQSTVIPDRQWLVERVTGLQASTEGTELMRPASWGGYRLVPRYFEFWQGRPDRLHDRLCYDRQLNGQWRAQRLAP